MAYRTISLQPRGVQTQQRRFEDKKHKAADKDDRRLSEISTNRVTLARSCAFIRVSLERREHHGSYEMTVAGPFPSQSSIRSGFCGPVVFWAKAPARTPCSGSFSKGSRAKTHVCVRPQLAELARLVKPRLTISGNFYRLEKINGERNCRYTLFLAQTKGSVSSCGRG
jgi:hypothetical protein